MRRRLTTLLFLFILYTHLPLNAQVSRIRQDFITYGFPRYEHCSMKILPGAKAKLQDLEEAISKAKHYIHIEYYKWYNDSIGRHLLDELAKAAKRSVKVRILYDASDVVERSRT